MYIIAFVHTFDDAPELGRVMLAETEEEAIEIACDMVRSEYAEREEIELAAGNAVINIAEHQLSTMTREDWLSSEGFRAEDGWSVCISILAKHEHRV